MKKFILALTMAALLVVALAAPALAADGDLVYDLTRDVINSYLSIGTNSEDGFIRNSGNGSDHAELVADGLQFTGRPNDYSTIDLVVKDNAAFDAGTDYTVVASMKTVSGTAEFRLVTTSGYSDLVDRVNGASATLSFKFNGDHANIRFQTAGEEDFIITSIKVYEGDPPAPSTGGGGTGTGSNPKTGVETYIFIALGALALAAAGAVVFARKAKV